MEDNDSFDDSFDDFEPTFDLADSDVEFGKCPMCKAETLDLEHVDDLTKLALADSDFEKVYDSVCTNCLIEMKDKISTTDKLKAERQQRLQELLHKWSNKINVLKTGRSLMSQKVYSEAQKYYEEYIQILEAVYNNGKEGLTPNMIPAEHRRQESTLLCGIFCDLMYIYDQYHPGTAQLRSAIDSLVAFLPLSRGQGIILRKIKKQVTNAKNKTIYEEAVQSASNKKSGCFIATAVFEDNESVELTILRNFRDHFLKKFSIGRTFVFYYYKFSPYLARRVERQFFIKKLIRKSLSFFCRFIDRLI